MLVNKKLLSIKAVGYYLSNLIGIVFLLLIDQWTKQLAVIKLKGTNGIPIIPKVFELFYLENTGVAFGMMKNQKGFILCVTILLVGVVFYALHKIQHRNHFLYIRICLLLILAGGIGNMIDRIANGFVVDFFSFVLIHFPIFNVADIYIVVGTILFCIYILFFNEENGVKEKE